MSELLKLTRVDFDGMENDINAAICISEEIYFTDDSEATAHAKCSNYLSSQTIKPYLGWDQKVYPIFKIKIVNSI